MPAIPVLGGINVGPIVVPAFLLPWLITVMAPNVLLLKVVLIHQYMWIEELLDRLTVTGCDTKTESWWDGGQRRKNSNKQMNPQSQRFLVRSTLTGIMDCRWEHMSPLNWFA